jgi:TRAP-type C4-dicarboxylate transport system permease small subunit
MTNRFAGAVDRGVEWLAAAIFGAIVIVALIQVFSRYALNFSLSWSEEAQIFGHIWIVFLGIPIAYRRGAHLYIETFCDMLPRGPRAAFNLAIELIWLAFAVSLLVLGWQVARIAHLQSSPGLEVPMSYPYSGMVLGGAYLLFVAVRRIGGGAWKVTPHLDAAAVAERAA